MMLRFMVIGDWGRQGHPGQRELACRMGQVAERSPVDFIISTGDNFYDTGVASVEDPHWQHSFEEIYKAPGLQVPWHSVLGNHDYDGNVQAQLDYTQRSTRWHMPDRYYHFHQPIGEEEALFVFMDTSPFISNYFLVEPKPAIMAQNSVRQLRWLEEVLASSQARWKIVIGHHPVYSSSPFHGNSPELIEVFEPLFETYKVDVYLCGHEHDLQLHQPEGHTHYLVSGAGSEIRETGRQPFTCFSASASGFAVLTLRNDRLRIEFVDHAGSILYQRQVVKKAHELSF